jgi:hypothetical protein
MWEIPAILRCCKSVGKKKGKKLASAWFERYVFSTFVSKTTNSGSNKLGKGQKKSSAIPAEPLANNKS